MERKKEALEDIRKEIFACHVCPLWESRTNPVFGRGNPQAKIMLIGEAPGENEDLQGAPFVGRSGKLLEEILEYVGLSTEKDVFITNILKCRPPQNRDPLPCEQDLCINFLKRQIRSVEPKLLVCVGRVAAVRIIDKDFKIMKSHGELFTVGKYKVTAVLHPAAILRNMNNLPSAREDWKKIKEWSETL